MSSFTFYHNPRCSKSRQALALLEENQVNFELVKYLETPLTPEQLTDLLDKLNMAPRALLRKGEADYKALNLSDESIKDEAIIAAMCSHPKLMERPILASQHAAVVGRPPENVLQLIGSN